MVPHPGRNTPKRKNGDRKDFTCIPESTWKDALKFWKDNKGKKGVRERLEERFGVNINALNHRRRTKNFSVTKLGAPLKLPAEAEELIADRIFAAQDVGACMTRSSLLAFANTVLRLVGKKKQKPLTQHWLRGFLRRNETIISRTPRSSSTRRHNSFPRHVADRFFRNVRTATEGLGPERIFICDETQVSLGEVGQVCQVLYIFMCYIQCVH